MTDETVVSEQPAEIRMAGEDDAEEVEGLALEPIRRWPQADDARQHGKFVVRCKHAHADTPVMRQRQQMIDGRVTRSLPDVARAVVTIIDTADIDQHVEAQIGMNAERPQRLDPPI